MNTKFSNEEKMLDGMLAAVDEIEELLKDIEKRNLYEQNDVAKLAKIKANFSAMHLKLSEQQKVNQPAVKTTTQEELMAELGTGEVELFDHVDEHSNKLLHVLPAAKLFPDDKTKLDKEL